MAPRIASSVVTRAAISSARSRSLRTKRPMKALTSARSLSACSAVSASAATAPRSGAAGSWLGAVIAGSERHENGNGRQARLVSSL